MECGSCLSDTVGLRGRGDSVWDMAVEDLVTIFHPVVCARKPALVDTFLSHDPNAKAVLDAPRVERNTETTFPVVSAIGKGSHSTLAVLLAYGAKYVYSEEDWSRARELR